MDDFSFLLRPATPADLDEILAVMDAAKAAMARPEWFLPDTREYMAAHIDGPAGFCLVAGRAGALAAYFTVKLPGTDPAALGWHLGMGADALCRTAQMDSCCVLPACQGNRLESRLMQAAEARLAALPGAPYRHYLGTVHPDNAPSLRSFLRCGYTVAATTHCYGGLLRHIVRKDVAPGVGAV
ncbi:MAG: GNAT family N-acetyltransferase [Gemmiger sp.]|nr:GNAT family N-acetyltransferase [Gemmiger sp.]